MELEHKLDESRRDPTAHIMSKGENLISEWVLYEDGTRSELAHLLRSAGLHTVSTL